MQPSQKVSALKESLEKRRQEKVTWQGKESSQKHLDRYSGQKTSFETVGYENTYSTKSPKPIHPQAVAYNTNFNIVTGIDEGSADGKGIELPEGEYNSISLSGIPASSRGSKLISRKSPSFQNYERPNDLRPKVVDSYIKSIMKLEPKIPAKEVQAKAQSWVKVIEQIYRLNLDNRILNNLRQQLNESIEDERGLV